MHVVWDAVIIAVCGLLALAGNPAVRALLQRVNPKPSGNPPALGRSSGNPAPEGTEPAEPGPSFQSDPASAPAERPVTPPSSDVVHPIDAWPSSDPAASPSADPASPRPVQNEPALPGGRWIGLLERAAVYACIVAGFPNGIGFVLAIKVLGRYPELRVREDPRLGELFIVGTLASLLWASAFAGIAVGLMQLW